MISNFAYSSLVNFTNSQEGNMFIALLVTIIVLGTLVVCRKWQRLQMHNESPLYIKTFDGSNSPYHPSVKYCKDGFGGFEYIMSETPFYLSLPSVGDNYRDQFECPSIHYSHDGIHWEDIILNPIDNLSEEEKKNRDYFSDPDLVVTPKGIECWYRMNRRYGSETNQRNIILFRKKSIDGIHWSDREMIVDLQEADPDKGLGDVVISQSLLFEDCKYKCWFVDDIQLGKEKVCFSESTDGVNGWSDKRDVKLNGFQITPWHLHILKDGDTYWLTIYDHRKITLWKSDTETEFQYVKTLLEPSNAIGSFYSHNTYRACLAKISDNLYRLYFSADDMFCSYIGVMEGISLESMTILSVHNRPHCTFKQYLYLSVKTKYTIYSKKVIYYTKRIYQKPIELIKSHVKY